jgi:pilus assembly protein CpaC
MTTDFSRTTHSEFESEDLNMLAAHTTQFWRSRPLQGRRPAAFFAALVVWIIVILVAAPQAQQPQVFNPTGTASATVVRDAASGSEIELMVGRSTVLNVGANIARVSLTVPDIADAMVTSPSQLLIHGKKPGTISLFVWDKGGAISTFEVKVRRDLSPLVAHMKQLFPGEDITVLGSGKDVVISGTVSSKYVIEKAADVAGGYVEKKEDVVNMLKQQEGVASNQVMLRVRFAEVSRSAMQELGASLIAHGSGSSDQWFGRTAPPGVPAPDFQDGKLVFSDFLNLFIFNAKENLGGVVRALSNKGLFQSLAEPNLIATNGKEASFLAGGEYPYPVVQSGSGTNSVTITFKEFGVRLSFTPTVLGGDLIHLKVKPEVSSLDFANAVVIDGFRVPALSTRRTETEVELRDGQTFAIAGLMNNTLTSTLGKIPGIGDIPILGLLFKSKAHQKNQTELVVMITPTILKKGQMGVSEGLPALTEPYLARPEKTYPSPDPFTGSPRYPADHPQPKEGNSTPPRQGAAQMPEPLKPATTAATSPSSAPAQKAVPVQSATTPAPVPSRPITQTAPVTPAAQPAAKPAPVTVAPAKATPQPAAKSTKASTPAPAASKEAAAVKTEVKEVDRAAERAADRAREQERKAADAEARQKQADAKQQEVEARQKAEEDKAAQLKSEEDRRQADRLSKERAKREAEIARKNAELAKKQSDEDAKREKALSEAAARLKAAQTQYQAEVEKSKGGSNEKSKESGKEGSGSTTKQ